MDYNYYRHNGEGYVLKKPAEYSIFNAILFGLMSLAGLVFYLAKHQTVGLVWFLVLAGIGALVYYLQRINTVCIAPSGQLIQVKRGHTVRKQYAMSEFMNFQTTRVRVNGIPTRVEVYMYFNENGKNRPLLLSAVLRKKTADRLIAETQDVLTKSISAANMAAGGTPEHKSWLN
jgi:hypothetical protein